MTKSYKERRKAKARDRDTANYNPREDPALYVEGYRQRRLDLDKNNIGELERVGKIASDNDAGKVVFPLTVQFKDKETDEPHSGFTITAPDVSGNVEVYFSEHVTKTMIDALHTVMVPLMDKGIVKRMNIVTGSYNANRRVEEALK